MQSASECTNRSWGLCACRAGGYNDRAMAEPTPNPLHRHIRDHRRQWGDCLYVYPVVSRRAKGLSIGVNLNPDKRCNFNCVYCQVDRHLPRGLHEVDLSHLARELKLALRAATDGTLWQHDRFQAVPPQQRRINDIAFSGDGEPTCLPDFDQAVQVAADVKADLAAEDVRTVVITNGTMLRSPQMQRALPILDVSNGEIWAKLDAGSEEYFRRINRPAGDVTLARIVDNIASVAIDRPVVIQTLLLNYADMPPIASEIEAYTMRLREILDAGGEIKLIQLHTVARPPAEAYITRLSDEQLDAATTQVTAALPSVPVETFYGQDVPPQARGPA